MVEGTKEIENTREVEVEITIRNVRPDRVPYVKAAAAFHWPFAGWLRSDFNWDRQLALLPGEEAPELVELTHKARARLWGEDTPVFLIQRIHKDVVKANRAECRMNATFRHICLSPAYTLEC